MKISCRVIKKSKLINFWFVGMLVDFFFGWEIVFEDILVVDIVSCYFRFRGGNSYIFIKISISLF